MVSGAIRTKCPSSELCSVRDHFHWLLLDNQKLIYTCSNSPSSCVCEQKSLLSAGFSAVPLLGPCVLLSCLSGIEVSHILHLSVFNAFGRFPHRRLRCSDTAALFTAGQQVAGHFLVCEQVTGPETPVHRCEARPHWFVFYSACW